MRISTLKLSAAALLAATTLLVAPAAMAVDLDVALLAKGGGGKPDGGGGGGKGSGDTGGGGGTPTANYSWMASDVDDMWALGSTGVGSTITVVDDFSSGDIFEGRLNIDGPITLQHHGNWTSQQAGLIAPGAKVVERDWSSSGPVRFDSSVFNVVNASYSLETTSGYSVDNLLFSKRDQTLIDAAWNGTALMAKAAGNDRGLAVGDQFPVGINSAGQTVYYQDYLGLALVGAPGALFVGALQTNGTTTNKAKIASYSTIAGSNSSVQNQFLVVGVDAGGLLVDEFANYGEKCGRVATGHCLYGTSFAAPVIAGYAAIVGSKFSVRDAAVVASRLLETTSRNTLVDLGAVGWDAADFAVYGQGEACLSCALAPINPNP